MRVKRLLAIAGILLSMASGPLSAGTNTWSAIGPAGGNVNKIAFSATANTVFLIASGGFYRSQDGGVTWQLISASFFNAPSDLRLDPADPTRVYVTAPNAPSLYVSTDGGSTLVPSNTLPAAVTQALQLAVSQNGATLCISSGAQFFCSADRGQTWQQRTAVSTDPIARISTLIIDPTDSNTLYASVITSAAGAMLATHDGGITWQALNAGSAGPSYANDLAINPLNPMQLWAARFDGVWFSGNRGITWSNVLSTPAAAIAVDPATPSIVYAGTSDGKVLRTADAGATWSDVTGNMSAGQVLSMAVNPVHATQLMVGGVTGLAVSSSSGTTWTVQQSGINSTAVDGLSADPSTDRIYVNVPTSGAFYEAAGSGTLQAVNNAGLLALTPLDPRFNDTAQLATAGHLYVSLETGVADSIDGGATWSLNPFNPGGNNQLFTMASPAGAPQALLAASSTALWRTMDAGATWTTGNSGLPPNAVIDRLFTAASNPSLAYASVSTAGTTVNLGVYSTADGGVTWTAPGASVSAGPTVLLAVDPVAPGTLFGGAASALLKSTDGGATWVSLPWDSSAASGFPSALTVDPVHPQIVVASSVASIMRSVDGGATWEVLRPSSALPIWSSLQLLMDPVRPENLLVGTSGSGVQQLTVAPDLTLTVAAPPSPVAVGVTSTYTYTVNNLGPFAATDVTISLQLPTSAQTVSATVDGGTCSVTSGAANCLVPIMKAGNSALVTLNATAPAAGPFAVSGRVSGDQPDVDPLNNTAAATSTVAVLSDLSVTAATVTPTVQVGEALNFSFTVNNAGPNAAPAARLAIQLPAGITSGTATSPAAQCAAGASGTINCTLNTLATASPVTINVSANASAAGNQTAAATVSTTAIDVVNANNSVTLAFTVNGIPLQLPEATPGKSGGGATTIGDLLALVGLVLARCRFTPGSGSTRHLL